MQNRRVWAEIDLDSLTSNLRRVRELAGPAKGVMAIVKANAYGHGAVPVAWHLASQGVQGVRLQARGFGPDRPVAGNDTTEGRQQNRRVEITLEPLTA